VAQRGGSGRAVAAAAGTAGWRASGKPARLVRLTSERQIRRAWTPPGVPRALRCWIVSTWCPCSCASSGHCGLGYGFVLARRGRGPVEVAGADQRQGGQSAGQGEDAADGEDLVDA
jgi:hypothetical protein